MDLRKRMIEHKSETTVTTARKRGWKLVYYETYLNKMDALGREKFLKGGSGRRYLKKQLAHYMAGVSAGVAQR